MNPQLDLFADAREPATMQAVPAVETHRQLANLTPIEQQVAREIIGDTRRQRCRIMRLRSN